MGFRLALDQGSFVNLSNILNCYLGICERENVESNPKVEQSIKQPGSTFTILQKSAGALASYHLEGYKVLPVEPGSPFCRER